MPRRGWFDATFEPASRCALLLDESGTILRANEAFRRFLGTTEILAGRRVHDVLGTGGETILAASQRACEGGRNASLPSVTLEPPQHRRRHHVDIEVYPQAPGEDGRRDVLVILSDRTGNPAERLGSTGVFYQAYLHSTNAMELTDPDGFLVDVNPAFERIYGFPREELIGQRPSVVASGKTDRSVYDAMWRDLHDPHLGAWSGEIVNRDRSGVEHPVLLAINAVRAADGTLTHFLGVAVDLTERRAWERQAMHADRLASLGQLAAGVAHEINTPLANIMLISESVRRRSTDPWAQGRLDSLLEQAESAAKIVRGLLDFGRRPDVNVTEVDLAVVASASIAFLRGKQSADVEVTLEGPPGRVVVHGDREQIAQVVTNLLNNAYDALDGHGQIRVTVDSEASWAHVRVSDDGPGIPSDVQAHLFEPFFTTKPEGKGTGLGLAICHGIVQSHGGTIDVESVVGRGTTFDVRLPRSVPFTPGESPEG